ncbi:MAG: RNA methyltransferase [Dysgonamonadaceae bacterium]|jgi:TrmH family RNA methyltransferase|nr:RNA methyltransferase [Dysgonamonadaceae bacterium]
MLSKNKIKYIRSLEIKKFRDESGCFLAEGNKLVRDILPFFECELLVAKPSWMAQQGDIRAGELIAAEDNDVEKASLLKTPQDVIAVFRQPNYLFEKEELEQDLSLVLDGIQDPGNMGTIIRLADWFGIKNVICSPDTVDIFNPKTVQATMGAIAHVKVFYTHLPELLCDFINVPVYGTFLEGKNIYEETLTANGLIVMGNEGKGISRSVAKYISRKLYIPNYPPEAETTESLNVAVAAAITCSEFRRRLN